MSPFYVSPCFYLATFSKFLWLWFLPFSLQHIFVLFFCLFWVFWIFLHLQTSEIYYYNLFNYPLITFHSPFKILMIMKYFSSAFAKNIPNALLFIFLIICSHLMKLCTMFWFYWFHFQLVAFHSWDFLLYALVPLVLIE